jgi:hypothetical protein
MEGRYTAVDSIPGLVAGLRKTWKSGKTLNLEWRLQQLRQLIKLLKENENQVHLVPPLLPLRINHDDNPWWDHLPPIDLHLFFHH